MTRQSSRRGQHESPRPNKLLGSVAVALCIMTAYALYKKMSTDLILGLAFLGAASAVISALESRMTGKFSFSPKSLEFNLESRRQLAKSAMNAEQELHAKKLIPLDEVVNEDD
jgi:hypothetical protein